MSLRKGTTIISGKGSNGTNGTDGEDGFSPIASVSKSGDTATISITDKNGTTTASVSDGATYTLPTASASTLGGVKVGTNLSIDANGVLSALGGATSIDYEWTPSSASMTTQVAWEELKDHLGFTSGYEARRILLKSDVTITNYVKLDIVNSSSGNVTFVKGSELIIVRLYTNNQIKMIPISAYLSYGSGIAPVIPFQILDFRWATYTIKVGYYNDDFGFDASEKFFLMTNNNRLYTPTGDYNPATKKYVDDLISELKSQNNLV